MYFPALSLSLGEKCYVNFGSRKFKFPAEGFSPIHLELSHKREADFLLGCLVRLIPYYLCAEGNADVRVTAAPALVCVIGKISRNFFSFLFQTFPVPLPEEFGGVGILPIVFSRIFEKIGVWIAEQSMLGLFVTESFIPLLCHLMQQEKETMQDHSDLSAFLNLFALYLEVTYPFSPESQGADPNFFFFFCFPATRVLRPLCSRILSFCGSLSLAPRH